MRRIRESYFAYYGHTAGMCLILFMAALVLYSITWGVAAICMALLLDALLVGASRLDP